MLALLSGTTGTFLTYLAFVTALVALVAYWASIFAARGQRGWFRIGQAAFGVHAVSVIGIIGTLFGLILTQQYQYHYVFSHSSNELPLGYSIACLWEGQEGSFLLWMSWHAILGAVLMVWGGTWRAGVLGTLASIQLLLTSMILGIYLDNRVVFVVFLLLLCVPLYAVLRQGAEIAAGWPRLARPAAAFLFLFLGVNLARAQTGFLSGDAVNWVFVLELAFTLGVMGFVAWAYGRGRIGFAPFAGTMLLGLLALAAFWQPVESWKIGSSPFLLLKQVRPNDPMFQLNPDYVPTNGNGLNSLLQNYWMVIHPPMLFLGFAATAIPFCFVVASLIERRYAEWVKAGATWTLFSVLVLGVGIIMGGYWAYETLNFGGYWNWDPVENASLVPWLTGVGSLHALLAFRRNRSQAHLTYALVIATFLLVLYSTFLTRSGILGEASVHSFTDLGLSGQLLILLFVYVAGIVLLLIEHWNRLPQPPQKKDERIWTREFFLYLAALVLAFGALEISLFTSLPVINKIIGTQYAPPTNVPFFYYKWNVWFGIAIAALSAVGQFFFWTKIEKNQLTRAISRPLLAAVAAALAVTVVLFVRRLTDAPAATFAFHDSYVKGIEAAADQGFLAHALAVLGNGLMMIADDLLLACALFTIFANSDIIFRLLRRSRKNMRHLGGSLAHIGFGLILLGALFSSGYQDVVSVNLAPGELSENFDEKARRENVQLWKHTPKPFKGYTVTYKGKVKAQAPIRDLFVVNQESGSAKVGFRDANGHRYAIDFPVKFFVRSGIDPKADLPVKEKFDFEKLKFFIENQLDLLDPAMMNERTLYEVEFANTDGSGRFTVYPETELSQGMGMTPHPSRKIYPHRDVYVHVTGFYEQPKAKWSLLADDLRLRVGQDTVVGDYALRVRSVKQVERQFSGTDFIARMHVEVTYGDRVFASYPMLVFDQQNRLPVLVDSYIDTLNLRLAFVTALPEEDRVVLRVLQKQAQPDYIVVNAIAKPWINLLWLGTFVMAFGFIAAIVRRVGERQGVESRTPEA